MHSRRSPLVVGLLATVLVLAACGVEGATEIPEPSESPAATEPVESEAPATASPAGSGRHAATTTAASRAISPIRSVVAAGPAGARKCW